MMLEPLCPDPTTWRIRLIAAERDRLVLHLDPLRRTVACPACGTRSRRVHSRYHRTPWDLPWGRWPVQLIVHARRFFCDVPTCLRQIFVEPFPRVLARYARQTNRLRQVLLELTHAMSAELAARLGPWVGYRVSADTLLCRQRAEPLVFPPPRVLGVDEFALRRGRRYGTLLVDLERRQPIEILPDTQADTLATWLRAQPQIQVISRDRAGQFAEGATVGAPQAMQVADRWHLLRNLGETVQRLLARHPAALRAAAQACVTAPPAVAQETTVPVPLTTPLPSAREQRFREVLARHAEGWSCRRIAQELGLHWRTVKRYILARELPKRGAPMLQATSTVPPYLAYLEHRWQEGYRVGTQLWLELRAQGYPGSLSSVYRALKRWRPADGRRQTSTPTTQPKRYALSPRQGMWLLLRTEGDLSERDCVARTVLQSTYPAIATATGLAQRFQQMVRDREAAALEPWLQEAASSGVPEFRRFAVSLRGDEAAVRAGLECPWSNGQLEGQINRVKVLKRVGYGRAKLDLLRQRILHRVVAPVLPIKDRRMDLVPAVA
ncbi:MAG TPA: ISL3 family transposase [Candidatus Tectomicrobia bacterium]|nr:ISL3 family transposase [Candidatus Tectomicrobia bacterium]